MPIYLIYMHCERVNVDSLYFNDSPINFVFECDLPYSE